MASDVSAGGANLPLKPGLQSDPRPSRTHSHNMMKNEWRKQHGDSHGTSSLLQPFRSAPKLQQAIGNTEDYFLVPREKIKDRHNESLGLGLRFRRAGLSPVLIAGNLKELSAAAWSSNELVWEARVCNATEHLRLSP